MGRGRREEITTTILELLGKKRKKIIEFATNLDKMDKTGAKNFYKTERTRVTDLERFEKTSTEQTEDDDEGVYIRMKKFANERAEITTKTIEESVTDPEKTEATSIKLVKNVEPKKSITVRKKREEKNSTHKKNTTKKIQESQNKLFPKNGKIHRPKRAKQQIEQPVTKKIRQDDPDDDDDSPIVYRSEPTTAKTQSTWTAEWQKGFNPLIGYRVHVRKPNILYDSKGEGQTDSAQGPVPTGSVVGGVGAPVVTVTTSTTTEVTENFQYMTELYQEVQDMLLESATAYSKGTGEDWLRK